MVKRINYYVIKYELQTTFSTEKARGPFGGEDSRLRNSHKFYSLRNTFLYNTPRGLLCRGLFLTGVLSIVLV